MLADLQHFWSEATTLWVAGGWCMPPIAFTCFVMFALGLHIWFELRRKGFLAVSEQEWRTWIEDPSRRSGSLGELIGSVSGAQSLEDSAFNFREARHAEIAPFERDLRVMRVCISAAPLLGLLGTVTGMLATFTALASGSGGEQTIDQIAKGISEALITTETGLVVALPGVFFQYQLARKHERYKAFLAHLETVCTQTLYRRLSSAKAT